MTAHPLLCGAACSAAASAARKGAPADIPGYTKAKNECECVSYDIEVELIILKNCSSQHVFCFTHDFFPRVHISLEFMKVILDPIGHLHLNLADN